MGDENEFLKPATKNVNMNYILIHISEVLLHIYVVKLMCYALGKDV